MQQFEAVPVPLCELSSAAINEISPCRAGSPKDDWEMQTLAMQFGREFLFVFGKAASISWTLREKFLLWSPERDSAGSLRKWHLLTFINQVQWRPLVIIAVNVINRCYQNQWSQNTPFKPIKNKPFIIINLSVIVIKLQIIPVHI
jgi:hypothetical protein